MASPEQIALRMYNVGFGDCFLVSFLFRKAAKHVLIDFGSTSYPSGASRHHLAHVAQCITEDCGGKLHAIVATHRHADHINGFDPGPDRAGPGAAIEKLRSDFVIQPWTESPRTRADGRHRGSPTSDSFSRTLQSMDLVARAALGVSTQPGHRTLVMRELAALSATNIANAAALRQLTRMARVGKALYVRYGSAIPLRIPGVRVRVLGPPTLNQTRTIASQRRHDPEEFWHLVAATVSQAVGASPFSKNTYGHRVETPSRWIVDRLKGLPVRQLLEVVRILDAVLNNTSVILMFEVGSEVLIFPGDAQIESWSYVLAQAENNPDLKRCLERATVYKVGHHGSLNGTPKSLWRMFKFRKGVTGERGLTSLHTFMSTLPGKHGSLADGTEVPRRPLLEALKRETTLHSTHELPRGALRVLKTIDLA